ncbi:MAG: alginate export family protein [Sedimentisphaerales bacterium]|nr:alginate export family protein [Sedimentisphaerales bacterium]
MTLGYSRNTPARTAIPALTLALTLSFILILAATDAQAQPTAQRERTLDEPFRLVLDESVPTTKRALFDWGGWMRSSYWALNEHLDRDYTGAQGDIWEEDGCRNYTQQQLRIWGHLNLDQAHQLYARMRLDYYDWHNSYDGDDSDLDGPNLERGWYNFRLSAAQNAYGWQPGDFDFNIRVGRQYVELGTGLALSTPLDAVVGRLYYRDWTITGLGAMSIPSTYNVDQSVPDDSKEDRRFWGIELRYNGMPDHEPFAYFLSQEDQDFGHIVGHNVFGYNSRYVGLGSRGRFFHRDLQYTCEVVSEFGKSHAWSADTRDVQNVHAWAFDTELRYIVPDQHDSQFAVEYVLASGDNDREFSPTNTLGGNAAHTPDHSFIGWGYRNTGLVLAPRLSNLGAVRLGMSSYALNQYQIFEKLQLGADFFFFHKQQAGGAASDSFSVNTDHYLGAELDLYADWRLTSDLAFMIRYGMFWPGDAFFDGTYRHVLFTGVTLNF